MCGFFQHALQQAGSHVAIASYGKLVKGRPA